MTPVIRTSGGFGSPLVLAQGFIRVEAGAVSVHPNFVSHGIASVAFNGVDTVTVTLDHEWPTVPANVRPLVVVTGTSDNTAVPMPGAITPGATPTFTIKWQDGSAVSNVATGTWYAFVLVQI